MALSGKGVQQSGHTSGTRPMKIDLQVGQVGSATKARPFTPLATEMPEPFDEAGGNAARVPSASGRRRRAEMPRARRRAEMPRARRRATSLHGRPHQRRRVRSSTAPRPSSAWRHSVPAVQRIDSRSTTASLRRRSVGSDGDAPLTTSLAVKRDRPARRPIAAAESRDTSLISVARAVPDEKTIGSSSGRSPASSPERPTSSTRAGCERTGRTWRSPRFGPATVTSCSENHSRKACRWSDTTNIGPVPSDMTRFPAWSCTAMRQDFPPHRHGHDCHRHGFRPVPRQIGG